MLRCFGFLLAAGVSLWFGMACDKMPPEEASFYQRAREIKVGATLDTVKRRLGSPSKVVDADSHCASIGGRKEWVYESFETPQGRRALSAGNFAFCSDENGVIVAVVDIVVSNHLRREVLSPTALTPTAAAIGADRRLARAGLERWNHGPRQYRSSGEILSSVVDWTYAVRCG